MKRKILVVEDDPGIRLGLLEVLKREGFESAACERGDAAVAAVQRENPDLVILDVMLPGRSGFDICRDLRKAGNKVAILMLTAKGQEMDKVIGLDSGADDYVSKPFGLRELVARLHALLRRTPGGDASAEGDAAVFRIGAAEVDPARFELRLNGQTESLTPRELALLLCFHRHRGRVLTRDDLLNKVWGVNYYGTTRTLDQTVAQLRKKIGDGGGNPTTLLTVHGVGYKLADAPA